MTDDELWFWYKHAEEVVKLGASKDKYARKNGLEEKKFSNMYYRLIYRRESDPEGYKKDIELGQRFFDSKMQIGEFCKTNGLIKRQVGVIATHLKYLNQIKEIIKERGEDAPVKMTFKKVEHKRNEPIKLITIEEKNDIEIVINKGVKVIIGQNIDSTKIIKIIELLKDL